MEDLEPTTEKTLDAKELKQPTHPNAGGRMKRTAVKAAPPVKKDGSKVQRRAISKLRREKLKERADATNDGNLPTLPPSILEKFGEGDLFCVGPDLGRVLAVLAARLSCRKWRVALERCGCTWDKVILAKVQSQTFAKIYDYVDFMVRAGNVAQIEDVLSETAAGDRQMKSGYYPPDSKSASLYLAASDPRYRPGQQGAATSVTINLSI